MKVLGCLLKLVLFIVAFVVLSVLPPVESAILTFIFLTNYFYQQENHRGRK